jgi:signal transduction histidine kinase
VVNSSEAIWRFEVEQPIDITLPIDEQIALFYKHAYLAECNDAMARMYGHDRADDIVGLRFGDFGLAANPANISALRKFISHGYRLQDVETTELDADGTEKHISNNVIGIVINGQLLRMWGTQRDETERKRVEAEIRTSHAQLRLLAARLQSIREQERTQIAREMHDVLGQSLTSLKLDLSWLKKKLPANLSADVQERLEGMSNQIDETVVSVKTLSSELRPGVLDKFGLAAAVEWQCKEFERRTGIKCNARVPSDELALSNDISTAQFRILQESLSNVARHSEATDVQVELSLSDTQLILRISDNGTGISQAQINDAASLGLLGMRERAELLGGHFKIEPTGTGTITISNIPLSTPTISITPK